MRTTGRLRPRTPAELDAAAREVYHAITTGPRSRERAPFQFVGDEGELLGPFNAMLAHPSLGAVLQRLGELLRYESSLPDDARELVILRVAAAWRCEYEWYAHATVARSAGVPAAVLDDLRTGTRPAAVSTPAAAALLLCDRQLDRSAIPDDEYAHIASILGEQAIIEVIAIVGYYSLLASLMRTFAVPLPPGVAPTFL